MWSVDIKTMVTLSLLSSQAQFRVTFPDFVFYATLPMLLSASQSSLGPRGKHHPRSEGMGTTWDARFKS